MILPVLLFFLDNALFSQPGTAQIQYYYIANYNLSYRSNTADKVYKKDKYTLLINGNSSLFRPAGYAVLDTVQLTKRYQSMTQDQQIAEAMKYGYYDLNDIILTELKNSTIDYTMYVNATTLVGASYTEKIQPDWKLVNETKKVMGLDCKKATRSLFGRVWTAWYAPKVPLPFGPYKFFGLPGLIVRVEDQTQSYIYELFYLKRRNHLHPTVVHENIKKMQKEKAVKLFNENKYSLGALVDATFSDPSVKQKMIQSNKEKRKKDNNPLELQPFDYN